MVVVCRLPTAGRPRWCLLLWSKGARPLGSVVVVNGLNCPVACGIFPARDQTPVACILGRFLTTGPPRESIFYFFFSFFYIDWFLITILNSVQFSRLVMSNSLWPHGLQHARLPCPSTSARSLLKFMSIELVMPCSHLILCRPLLLLPSIFFSIRVFSNESVLHIRWPKYWSFSFSISPSNEYSGLISFRMDWLDLLAVQGILKNLLQHHSSKTSVLRCSAFFIIQFSHPYMTTGKTIASIRWTFVGKVMSLLLNMLSRLVIAFLPRSKCLLISWLQTPSAVILESPKNKVSHCFHYFPIYLPWSDGTRCHDLSFLKVEF